MLQFHASQAFEQDLLIPFPQTPDRSGYLYWQQCSNYGWFHRKEGSSLCVNWYTIPNLRSARYAFLLLGSADMLTAVVSFKYTATCKIMRVHSKCAHKPHIYIRNTEDLNATEIRCTVWTISVWRQCNFICCLPYFMSQIYNTESSINAVQAQTVWGSQVSTIKWGLLTLA